MRVMILCGGQGMRLREHAGKSPKPMVAVGDRPILWHIMKLYRHFGCWEFILCLGYMGWAIKEYFMTFNARHSDITVGLGGEGDVCYHPCVKEFLDWKVTLAETGEDVMTGARIKRAARYLEGRDGTFAVAYGDGLADVDVRRMLDFHKTHGRMCTITGVRAPGRFGVITHDNDRVLRFEEKPLDGGSLINGGFFLFERRFLDYLSEDPGCALEGEPLQKAVRDGEARVYEHDGFWQCMDTPRDWELLERRWQSGSAPWKVWE